MTQTVHEVTLGVHMHTEVLTHVAQVNMARDPVLVIYVAYKPQAEAGASTPRCPGP